MPMPRSKAESPRRDSLPGFFDRPCPLCGEARAEAVFTAADVNHGFPGTFQFVRCSRCGMIYQSPCARGDAIKALYPQAYATPAAYTPSELERRLFLPVHRRRAEIIEKHVPKGSLLEIGCGGGLFAKFMERRGWRISGVEASAANVEYARNRLGLTGVRQGRWPPDGCLPPPVDLVVMVHLIEHLTEPVQALAAARRVLAVGGRLIIETPNVESWPFRLFGGFTVTVDAPRHQSLFSKASLIECVRRAGFEPCDLETFSPSTIEYSESLRHTLRKSGLRRAGEKRFAQIGPARETPHEALGREQPMRSLLKAFLHRLEARSYAAINSCADRKGVGNNLLMVARPVESSAAP